MLFLFLLIQKLMLLVSPNSHDCQVKVVDRTAVITANAETVVVKPLGIQEAINMEIGKSNLLPNFIGIAFYILRFAHA